jgi:hypothetical protein
MLAKVIRKAEDKGGMKEQCEAAPNPGGACPGAAMHAQ